MKIKSNEKIVVVVSDKEIHISENYTFLVIPKDFKKKKIIEDYENDPTAEPFREWLFHKPGVRKIKIEEW